MKELKALVKDLEYELVGGSLEGEITDLVYDSRKISEGCIFVCIKGANFNGHDYADEAAKKGAKAIVISEDVEIEETNVTLIKTGDTRVALARLSAAYFDYPANEVKVIGVTGTKGKTTTTYIIRDVLKHSGRECGLIGTIEIIIGDEHIPASNTTPESYLIQSYLRRMANEGIKYCVMEASSQGFLMHRTEGLNFSCGVFTNLSPDHIGPNEHKDYEDYKNCKALLFTQCEMGFVNNDDENADFIRSKATCPVSGYAIEGDGDIKAGDIKLISEPVLGTSFKIEGKEYMIPLPGYFSVYNALCAISVCRHFGIDDDTIKEALMTVKVRGRIEPVDMPGNYSLIIDYAHNALSLESILKTMREYDPGRLICIFGCGGNRDPQRRFEMGEVSGKLSDLTIITSDNPRFEEPMAILKDIETGIKKTDGAYVMEIDRKEAIRYAIKNAKDGDLIVLAGKGHEDYQEIKGVKHHMDERELVNSVLTEEGLI